MNAIAAVNANPALPIEFVPVERDPGLESERGQALRLLLYLFGRDAAIRLLRAG